MSTNCTQSHAPWVYTSRIAVPWQTIVWVGEHRNAAARLSQACLATGHNVRQLLACGLGNVAFVKQRSVCIHARAGESTSVGVEIIWHLQPRQLLRRVDDVQCDTRTYVR